MKRFPRLSWSMVALASASAMGCVKYYYAADADTTDADLRDAVFADAAVDANPAVAHKFVVDQVILPTKSGEGATYGLDLDGDGHVDNAFNHLLSALSSAAGAGSLNIQVDELDATNQGTAIVLVDLDAPSLTTAPGASLRTFIGANPIPMACLDPSKPTTGTCGQHLKGTASFSIVVGSTADAHIDGTIVAGHFVGGPGTATVRLRLLDADLTLNLIGARADLPMVATSGITAGILAGAIPSAELDGNLLPDLRDGMSVRLAKDCNQLTVPPACGCASGSLGATYLSLFDKAPADCALSVDEIRNSDLIKTLLAPDVVIGGVPALSFGVGVSAVGAFYPLP